MSRRSGRACAPVRLLGAPFFPVTAGHASAIGPISSFRFDAAAAGSGGIPFPELAQGQSEAPHPDTHLMADFGLWGTVSNYSNFIIKLQDIIIVNF